MLHQRLVAGCRTANAGPATSVSLDLGDIRQVLPGGVAVAFELSSNRAGRACQTSGDAGPGLADHLQVMDDIAFSHGKMTVPMYIGIASAPLGCDSW